MKLTPKQKLFCDEYLVDLNATRSYKAIYKNCKKDETAKVNGSRLLTNANVKEYLQKRMKDREKRTEITQDFVLKELFAIASANGTDFANIVEKKDIDLESGESIVYKTVELRDTTKIPEEKKKAISGIKQGKYGIEISSCDKLKALELLGRHLGMWTEKVELSGNVNNPFENLTDADLKKLIHDG